MHFTTVSRTPKRVCWREATKNWWKNKKKTKVMFDHVTVSHFYRAMRHASLCGQQFTLYRHTYPHDMYLSQRLPHASHPSVPHQIPPVTKLQALNQPIHTSLLVLLFARSRIKVKMIGKKTLVDKDIQWLFLLKMETLSLYISHITIIIINTSWNKLCWSLLSLKIKKWTEQDQRNGAPGNA